MRLLIVEDDEFKRTQAIEFLKAVYADVEIVEKRSLQGGLRELIYNKYDVVILDMSLPNYDVLPEEPEEGLPQNFAGREILQQLDRRKIVVPVIIFTGFDIFGQGRDTMSLSEIKQELDINHNACYIGTVYYNATMDEWKHELVTLIDFSTTRSA